MRVNYPFKLFYFVILGFIRGEEVGEYLFELVEWVVKGEYQIEIEFLFDEMNIVLCRRHRNSSMKNIILYKIK